MSKQNKNIYFLISTIFFIIFDIYFSNLIINSVRFQFKENSIIDLIFVKNTGAAFSILENFQALLIVFSIVASILIMHYMLKNSEKFSAFASFWCSMLLAGIFCNLYERITFGYVRDFFKLNIFEFPIFNISDIFINLSVWALIIIIIKNKYLQSK